MPKKLYPQISRYGAASLAKHEAQYTPDPLAARGEKPFSRTTIARWRRQMGHGMRKDTMLYQPIKNGENDALSITCLVDLLLRIDHDAYVFPSGMTALLEQEYGHLVRWDVYTVGRIFSNLIGNSPLLADKGERPIGTVHWGGARHLVINWSSWKAWQWLGEIRERMGRKAHEHQIAARKGHDVPRDAEIWNLVESIEWAKL